MKSVHTTLLLILVAVLVFTPAHAQLDIGLTAGLDLPRDQTGQDVATTFAEDAVFGGFAELTLSAPFSLRAEVQYTHRTATVTLPGVQSGSGPSNVYSLNYMQFPVDMRLTFGGTKLRGFVFGGTTIGTLMRAVEEKSEVQNDGGSGAPPPSASSGLPTQEEIFNPVDLSLDVGGGAAYGFTKDLFFSSEIRYMFGVNDAAGDPVLDASSWHVRNVRILGGLYYVF